MELINKVIKEEVRDLRRITDCFDDRFDYLRLDKNERLLPFEERSLEEFKRKIRSEQLSGYAELGPMYRKLAKYLNVTTEQLLLASGSDLAIKSVYEACVNKNDNIVLHLPCYAMYKVYAKMFGAKVQGVPLLDDWSLDLDGMLKLVDDKTKFIAIENPNGFVGSAVSFKDIAGLAAELKKRNVMLLLDEAYHYIENGLSDAAGLIKDYPNLIISQTFSKGHGLAGARMGYLIGDAELIGYISRVRPMHEITSLTMLAAEWVIDHPGMLAKYRKSVEESKRYLKKALSSLGVKYKDTHANFMLLYLPEEGATLEITQKLKERKILVRRPFEESYLRGWSRVCVGTLEDSKRFIKTLGTILQSGINREH